MSSDDLLSTLVNNIRQACEKEIAFEDFLSVSGFICFDTDGSKQQCFVISELLHKKHGGEGHSAHLKTLDWSSIDSKKPLIWHPGSGSQDHVESSACLPFDQVQLQTSPTGLQGSFANLHSKLDWCNRTFTLKAPDADNGSHQLSFTDPMRNISTSTITVSKKDCGKENPRSETKMGFYNRSLKEGGISGNRWLKRYKTNVQHTCYPRPLKRTMKRSKPFHNEKLHDKYVKACSSGNRICSFSESETIKALDHDEEFKRTKSLYNSPSEKPTALSWFEKMISPSSSVESIDSIEPFYLVPQSEPLSNPKTSEDDGNSICNYTSPVHHNHEHQLSNNLPPLSNKSTPYIHRQCSPSSDHPHDEKREEKVFSAPTKQESPYKVHIPQTTNSSCTLNTISSIEPDVLTVVRGESPERAQWKMKAERPISLSSPDAHNIEEDVAFYKCTTNPKKRASLLKWMRLFKKGCKTSSNLSSSPGTGRMQKGIAKMKHQNKTGAYSMLKAPIDIRLKQWN